MKWNLFLFSFKIYLVKYAIPKFETSGVKSNDFTSLQSWAILPSKLVFESRGQNNTWHQPLTSLSCQNHSHNGGYKGEEETTRAILCSRCPKPAKLPKHNIYAGYTNISVPLRSGCSSEMGPVCPKTPTRLQGSDIKIRFAMFGTFWRVVLWAKPFHFEYPREDKNEIMFKKGCDTNEGHC